MVILGLTGSIGMGKSTAADMFRRLAIPVHDADATVHQLLKKGGGAVAGVGQAFPSVMADGEIDRGKLAEVVFGDAKALHRLEMLMHPEVRKRQEKFLQRARMQRQSLVVLDIPLLFETGGAARCDAVVVASAPAHLQRRRVMSRPGMTGERYQSILARQMPDHEKRRRADFIVPTGLGRAFSFQRVREIVESAKSLDPGQRLHRDGKYK